MKIKLVLSLALLLPCLAISAEDSYEIDNCPELPDLADSMRLSDPSIRITKSRKPDAVTPQDYSRKGSLIIIEVPDYVEKAAIEESARKSRVSEEFEKIVHASVPPEIKALAASQKAAGVKTFRCLRIVQKNDLARITIKAGSKDDHKTIEKTYIAGPAEHWYFSADVPLTSTSQMKYDAQTSAYVEKEVPSSFYASINYKIGDVFDTTHDLTMSLRNIALKPLMVKVNGPLDSYGAGISYDAGPAILFAARIWTKNDPSASDAETKGVYSTIFGISFDVEHGLGWITGK